MAVLKYSALRLGLFAVVFFICLYVDLGDFTLLFALIIGLIVSWAVGYLFFNRWRIAAAEQLANLGGKRKRSAAESEDNAAEDEQAERFHEDDDAAEDR